MEYELVFQVFYSVLSVFTFLMCRHYEKLIFSCPLLIGSEETINMTSDWLIDLQSANFSNSL